MRSRMSRGYVGAQNLSYAGQSNEAIIPASDLDGIVEIPLGFQPAGIAAKNLHDGTTKIAVAAYFEPAVMLARVERLPAGLVFKVSWIRGVLKDGESIRLFPDILQPSGANRAQTVSFGQDRTLWVSRNAERSFFVFSPPAEDDKWRLKRRIDLPPIAGQDMVSSALLVGKRLFTIEISANLTAWSLRQYLYVNGEFHAVQVAEEIVPWTCGIGKRGTEGLYFVKDFRAEMSGIFRNDELVVPDVNGNGICFLADGSALVTRYGQGHKGAFNGVPGAIIYIPAHLFR